MTSLDQAKAELAYVLDNWEKLIPRLEQAEKDAEEFDLVRGSKEYKEFIWEENDYIYQKFVTEVCQRGNGSVC